MSQLDRFILALCWFCAGVVASVAAAEAAIGSTEPALLSAAIALAILWALLRIERLQAEQAANRAERDQWLEQYVQLLERQAHLR